MQSLSPITLVSIGGESVRDGILAAYEFADIDPYRAATHNKGIMNGVSAVVLATGNDTRAVEAGAHAYAAQTGRYRSLSHWEADRDGNLTGMIELPMPVGLIGGATKPILPHALPWISWPLKVRSNWHAPLRPLGWQRIFPP
nr:hypothetical protein [Marinobacter sp. LV10MA510-1]